MTARVQRAIAMALAVISSVLGLWLAGEAWSARDDVQMKSNALERELYDKRNIAANHAEIAIQLAELREMLGFLVQQLPSRFDRPAMENVLRDQARLAGIEIASLRMGTENLHEGFYAELPAQIVAQGSSAQFLKFMDAMQREIALRRVGAMKVESIAGTTMLRATITLAYFRYIDYAE